MLIKNSSKKKYFGRDRVRTCDLPVISRTRYRLRYTDVELFFPIKKIFSLTLPTELFYFAKLKNIFGRDRVRTCDLPGRSRTRLPLRHTAFFQFSIKKTNKRQSTPTNPLGLRPHLSTPTAGFEPATSRFITECATAALHGLVFVS